ncbi:hypothetical protein M3221_13720 [Domibacillus indicus]|uniref:hypothetical protein n=1 Tax=Domibacillus indicus TaxID=1437523 RepID=UPI00203A81F4|nr:hypothetical protein [Domibacillus indicus]MCM3789459.1 hypothetical protein [Domibacillus indicus]
MFEQRNSIILQSSDARRVTYEGAGMYMFQPQPGRKPLTDEEWQARCKTFDKRIEEARKRLAKEKTGGDAA